MKYLVWKVECEHCGWDAFCGEDEGSIPEECPDCHQPDWVEEPE
jgi:predicted Zn-ribbon and HTH transcriptional regulator